MKIIGGNYPTSLSPAPFLIILVIVTILGGTGCKNPTREQNRLINPQIYPAFRRIEIHAYEYVMKEEVNRKEYERCKELIAVLAEDARKSNKYEYYSVSAVEWYAILQWLGFELPPLYLDKPPTVEETTTAEELQAELMSKLMETMNRHTKFTLDEFQERLDNQISLRSKSAKPSEIMK